MTTFLVTATGTDVGKTWVGTRLATELTSRGRTVSARKPALSFAPVELGTTDAELLGAATGEDPTTVCPAHRWYAVPMAPFMAADVLGRDPVTIGDLVAETIAGLATAPATGTSVTLVEGAGGPRSPLGVDGDNLDLARGLGIGRALLVADAGLGTINAVRLCVDAMAGLDTIVFLNRFDAGADLHRRNRDWLDAAGYGVTITVPHLADALEARLSQ
ncbi:MAG: ATP-dependent dethiobiotin synthetase BioD [Acidimicrobiia bacterium]